mmetsp:Transcript_25937/g.78876  ORF Transcript_25937/g.78876 Transcript_25937/m.78876 type:complete len:215 (+) Transcript_25937:3397-4041(+)
MATNRAVKGHLRPWSRMVRCGRAQSSGGCRESGECTRRSAYPQSGDRPSNGGTPCPRWTSCVAASSTCTVRLPFPVTASRQKGSRAGLARFGLLVRCTNSTFSCTRLCATYRPRASSPTLNSRRRGGQSTPTTGRTHPRPALARKGARSHCQGWSRRTKSSSDCICSTPRWSSARSKAHLTCAFSCIPTPPSSLPPRPLCFARLRLAAGRRAQY